MGYYRAGKYWEDKTLWQAAEGKPCIELSVSELADMSFDGWNTQTLADVARETRSIIKADMNYPILVTPEHRIMDGCHRVVKAVIYRQTSIKAIILDVSDKDFPKPDYDEQLAVKQHG